MTKADLLEDRAVLSVSGAEASAFLQGLITNDMDACADGRAIYTGLLTPQGKILFDFLVAPVEGGFLLDCAATRAADLAKRLTFYKLRAKAEIATPSGLAVAALWDGSAPPAGPEVRLFADPRLPALGWRAIGPRDAVTALTAAAAKGDYDAHRLALGVPDSADLPPDSVFALDAGFEELNGVNFKKGCYVGQEVTSRMKHRASARKRFLIASIPAALPSGTPVEADGREIGTLASVKNGTALALVRLDRFADALASQAPISAGGHNIVLKKPDWLRI